MDKMAYIWPHGSTDDPLVLNFAKKMFALKLLWETVLQSNFGIDGNINFSEFRFSFIQINPGDCDYPIIATYPAINLHSSHPKECFDFWKDGPYRKDRKHTLFKFKGMASDIDFIASDLLNEHKAGGENFGLIKNFKVG